MTKPEFWEMLGTILETAEVPCSMCPVWEYIQRKGNPDISQLCKSSCKHALTGIYTRIEADYET